MAHETDFWTWKLDPVTERNSPRLLSALVLACYLAGALTLIAQAHWHMARQVTEAGTGLVLAAIGGSMAVCVRVMLGRAITGRSIAGRARPIYR